jgi:hypothetical protein
MHPVGITARTDPEQENNAPVGRQALLNLPAGVQHSHAVQVRAGRASSGRGVGYLEMFKGEWHKGQYAAATSCVDTQERSKSRHGRHISSHQSAFETFNFERHHAHLVCGSFSNEDLAYGHPQLVSSHLQQNDTMTHVLKVSIY